MLLMSFPQLPNLASLFKDWLARSGLQPSLASKSIWSTYALWARSWTTLADISPQAHLWHRWNANDESKKPLPLLVSRVVWAGPGCSPDPDALALWCLPPCNGVAEDLFMVRY